MKIFPSREIIFCLAILLVIPASAAEVKPSASPNGNAQNGKALFLAHGCYACHSTVGSGSPRTGPALVAANLPYAVFVSRLRTPVSEMPPYTGATISDAQVMDLYAYVVSLPPPPDYKTIRLLQ